MEQNTLWLHYIPVDLDLEAKSTGKSAPVDFWQIYAAPTIKTESVDFFRILSVNFASQIYAAAANPKKQKRLHWRVCEIFSNSNLRKSFSLFAKSLRKHRSAFANKEKEFLKLAQFKKKKVI